MKDFPENQYNTIFPNGTYSAWDLLEHIRITQKDILDFVINPAYKETLKWPDDYWPPKTKKANKEDWEKTITDFNHDLKKLQELAIDSKIDLSEKIAWGEGQTIVREFHLVADHNAYHLGEFAIMRQVMGTWGKTHDK